MDPKVRRVAFGLALSILFAPAAYADPLPASPNSVDGANRWINPAVRSQDVAATVTLEITEITSTDSEKHSVSAIVRNDGEQAVENLELIARYADPEASVAGLRTVLAAEIDQFPNVLPSLNLGGLAPGEQRSVVMELPDLPGPAVYPMLLGVQSAIGLERTQRFLYSVNGQETAPTDQEADETENAVEDDAESVTPVTVVMPITASVDIVGGETGEAPQQAPLILTSEQLGEQLAPGGRLHTLIHSIPEGQVRQATCLALDPQLVETVMRMAQGYTIAQSRPSSVSKKKRLRDSWSLGSEETPKAEGAHVEDAQAWLDDVREVASCSVALPWANTDLNAVEATGNPWLMREALQRGTQVLRDAGLSPMTNVVIPGGGYINAETVHELGFADYAGAENGSNGLTTDINAAWEAAREREGADAPDRADSDEAASSLDAPTATGTDTLSAPTPTVPVSVLVADNTVYAPERFASLGENIRAVTYQGSLAATLAEAIASPMTVGYGNYFARFDYALDSQPARTATANAAITVSMGEETPVLMMLPSDAEDPSSWMRTLADLIDRGSARPLTLAEYLDPGEVAVQPTDTGTPYDDPTVIADTEILQARQQADYTDDLTRLMINDPAIALTPYNFTSPVRHEVLRALSRNGRGSILTFDAKVNQARETLTSNRAMLSELRASVSLLPPGNVYTRLSDGSPLLIAAQNGLPLPVDARIRYTGPPGASINVGEVIVPAKGSMTVQMTANLPTSERTNLELWLATPQGAAISHPVNISVQTRSGIIGASSTVLMLVLGLVAALAVRVVRRRKKATSGE